MTNDKLFNDGRIISYPHLTILEDDGEFYTCSVSLDLTDTDITNLPTIDDVTYGPFDNALEAIKWVDRWMIDESLKA